MSVNSVNNNPPVNPGSSPQGGNSLNWPYDPNTSIPNIPNGQGMTFEQQLAALEQAMNFLENNPNSQYTYNGSIATLQLLITMGQSYSSWTPAQQSQFSSILSSMSGSSGSQFFNDVVKNVMLGSFFQNGASGFNTTNAFCGSLVQELEGLSSINPLFNNLAGTANAENFLLVNSAESSNPSIGWSTTIDGQTFLTLGNGGSLMDFSHFLALSTLQLGDDLNPVTPNSNPSPQNGLDEYYSTEANSIFAQFENGSMDPSLAIMLLMMLIMNGQAPDLTRQINGYGNQLQSLNGQQNLVNNLLSTIRNIGSTSSGSLTPAQQAQQFMQQLTQLKQSVDEFDPTLAPTLDTAINSLLSGQVTLTSQPNGLITQYNTSTGGIYSFPTLPPGVTLYVNGVQISPSSPPQYVPAGTMITIMGSTTPTPYTFSLQQLGASDMLNPAGSGTGVPVYSSLGDFKDIANYLNSAILNPTNGVLETMQSAQTVLAGQSPMINTLITNDTNTAQTLYGFSNNWFTNATTLTQQINQNASRAGE